MATFMGESKRLFSTPYGQANLIGKNRHRKKNRNRRSLNYLLSLGMGKRKYIFPSPANDPPWTILSSAWLAGGAVGAPAQAANKPANTTARVNFTKIAFTNLPSLRRWARSGNYLGQFLYYPHILDMASL